MRGADGTCSQVGAGREKSAFQLCTLQPGQYDFGEQQRYEQDDPGRTRSQIEQYAVQRPAGSPHKKARQRRALFSPIFIHSGKYTFYAAGPLRSLCGKQEADIFSKARGVYYFTLILY